MRKKGCKKYVDEVVVVDDGSSDSTAEIAYSVGAYVVRHGKNGGYGAALPDMLRYGQGSWCR